MSKTNGDGKVTELHRLYRPKDFKEVIGQPEAVAAVQALVNKNRVPQAVLFTGGSGCGKTTLARILASKVGCQVDLVTSYHEINAAEVRGIEHIRNIGESVRRKALGGNNRCWVFDECHKLTSDAQNALLKMTEDPPAGVYYFFATTDPHKVIATLRGRCTEIPLKPIGAGDLEGLLLRVLQAEEKGVAQGLCEKIARVADGSARNALKILNAVIDIGDEDEQLQFVEKADLKRQAIELARALFNPRTKWPEVAAVLKELKDEEPEGLRHMILAYCTSVMLGGGKMTGRAYEVAGCFERNYFDSKRAGLVLSCYEAMHSS